VPIRAPNQTRLTCVSTGQAPFSMLVGDMGLNQ
jgi:hypothetical protein